MSRAAVFLDRDGTINEEMGYINHLSRFHLFPGVAKAIRLLNERQILAVVVSNQSGVARGYFPLELVHEVHAHMEALLSREGARIDGIFFCPHHPHGEVQAYSKACECRKPGTGLLREARERLDIDMERSWVIGDRCTDLTLAARAGLPGILVKTGYGLGELDHVLPQSPHKPVFVARDLLGAVQWILDRHRG